MKKLVFLFVLLCTQGAIAQEAHPFYLFGQIGSAKVDVDQAGNDAALRSAGATNLSSTVTDSASAFMIGAGYKFVPQASVEFAYLGASDFNYKATFTQGTATAKFSGSGVGVNVVGYLPVADKVDLYGKLGFWSFSVDATATVSAAGFAQITQSSSNTTPMIGVGIEYKVTPQVGIRAEYDHFSKIGDDTTIGSSKLDYLSAGIAFSF
jgi:OOP family OmpA-OmpF porin